MYYLTDFHSYLVPIVHGIHEIKFVRYNVPIWVAEIQDQVDLNAPFLPFQVRQGYPHPTYESVSDHLYRQIELDYSFSDEYSLVFSAAKPFPQTSYLQIPQAIFRASIPPSTEAGYSCPLN